MKGNILKIFYQSQSGIKLYEHVLEKIQRSFFFFSERFILKLKNTLKCTHLKSLNVYASVSVCLHASTVRRSCSSDWPCSQSQQRHTAREWTTCCLRLLGGVSVYNPSLLLCTLTAPLSTSVLRPNHKPLTMAQQPIRYETQPLYSVKTLLVLRYYCKQSERVDLNSCQSDIALLL